MTKISVIFPIMLRLRVNRALRGAAAGIILCALAAGCAPKAVVSDAPAGVAAPKAPDTPSASAPNGAAATAPVATALVAPAAPAVPPPPAPPPPPVLPFDDAVDHAAHAVFTAAATGSSGSMVVIDPLVDGMTGYQSKATQTIQDHIMTVAKSDFPQYTVQRLTADSLRREPRILIGTFTPVNAQMKTTGQREAYRFCLVMGDLKTGKIIAKSVQRARIEDADATPTSIFGESPVWTQDPSIQAYIATCQASKVGDAIKPEYIEGLLAAAVIAEAVDAYDEGRYQDALDLFATARKSPAGDQLRVYNGIYLSLTKLGRTDQAAAAFGELVDYGLRKQRLAVKFLFQPGSIRFANSSNFSGYYGMWLQQIAAQTAAKHACIKITGHTSPTGPAVLNDNLSLTRAEYIQSRLEREEPALQKRTIAAGVGSRENLIGTGRDDATDLLDRRVELAPIDPCG
jgi:hypothetical protein